MSSPASAPLCLGKNFRRSKETGPSNPFSRATLPPERLRRLPVKRPAHPIASMSAIVVILALAASTVFIEGLKWTVPLFLAWLALTTFLYLLQRN